MVVAVTSKLVNTNIPKTLPRKASSVVLNNPTTANMCGQTAPSLVPNFIKKGYDSFIEVIAKGVGKFAQAEWVQKTTRYCVEKNVNTTAHLAAACANILNGFYMYNVSRSKKIEEEQKGPLMLNMFIGTLFSTAGGYLVDGAINKKLKPFDDFIEKHYPKNADNIKNGFRIAKGLMVFQLLYRFVSPVIATPIANHISNKVREKKEGDKGNLTV